MLVDGQLPTVDDNPVTIGHEATGKIVALGSKVRGFKKGDYIGFINAYHGQYCGAQERYFNY